MNGMPNSGRFTGLSRKVMEYSECFATLVETITKLDSTPADWTPIESMVDLDTFQRVGVFLTATVETIGWNQYKQYISQYAGATRWEGTLRRITEGSSVVIQELEERNTRGGVTDIANTVMIYRFNEKEKIDHLDVYVAHLGTRPDRVG